VQSINFVAERVQVLVPEARLAVAHGRMAEGELEAVMADFTKGEIDVLVCTTIIESGLDVPNANTMIVNRADRFGLTQLYQLRGRVGRGVNLAYAYFLYDKGMRLTDDAEKRLRTIYEATELGAGFNIAIKDLEIRGAGNLLGIRQSGHINAVGFSLYTRLLAEAVEELKAARDGRKIDEAQRLPPPMIDLPLPAYIPEEYIGDTNTRLNIYQRLSGVNNDEQIDDMAKELDDRFGAVPREVNNLLYAVRIKLLAIRAGIESIATEEGRIVLRLFEGMHFDKEKVEAVLGSGVKFGLKQIRIDYRRIGGEWQKVLENLLIRLG
ncbi:MAG TPA: transcription-repair coupling factor, partial [Dehalococcoidia bacterium]|nr:transcription-repair coupling factor [Dehalococcoidia bacterium]